MKSSVATRGETRRSFLPKRGSSHGRQESPLCVGDVVLVNGVKRGQLLYRGETSFAEGTWCGVELETPDGRHDGVVEGRRYFRCAAQHGIFAPLARVTLDRRQQPPVEANETAVAQATKAASDGLQQETQKTAKIARQEVVGGGRGVEGVEGGRGGRLKRKATQSKLRRVSANVRAAAEPKNATAVSGKAAEGRLSVKGRAAAVDSPKRGRLRQRASARSLRQRNTCCASDASSETSSVSPRPSSRPSSPRVDAQTALTLTYVGDSDSDIPRLDTTFRMTSPTSVSSCDNAGEWDGVFSSNVMASSLISNASSLGLLTDDQLQDITLTTAADWDMSGASTPQGRASPDERLSPIPHGKLVPAPTPFQTSTPSSWKVTETADETFYVLDPVDRLPSSPSDVESQHGSPFDSLNALDESMELACTAVAQYAALVEGAEREGEVQARLTRRRQQCREEKERIGRLQRSLVVAELHATTDVISCREEPTTTTSTFVRESEDQTSSGDTAVDLSPLDSDTQQLAGATSSDDISLHDSLSPRHDTADNVCTEHSQCPVMKEQNGDNDKDDNDGDPSQNVTVDRAPSVLSAAAVDIVIDDASPVLKPSTKPEHDELMIFDDSSGCELSNNEFATADRARERPVSFLSTCSVGTDILDDVSSQCHQKSDRPLSVMSTLSTDDMLTSSNDDAKSDVSEDGKPHRKICSSEINDEEDKAEEEEEEEEDVQTASFVLESAKMDRTFSNDVAGNDRICAVSNAISQQTKVKDTDVRNTTVVMETVDESLLTILSTTFTEPNDPPIAEPMHCHSSSVICPPADVTSSGGSDVIGPVAMETDAVVVEDNAERAAGDDAQLDHVDNAIHDMSFSEGILEEKVILVQKEEEEDSEMNVAVQQEVDATEKIPATDTLKVADGSAKAANTTTDGMNMDSEQKDVESNAMDTAEAEQEVDEEMTTSTDKSHNMSDSTIKDSVPEKRIVQPKVKSNANPQGLAKKTGLATRRSLLPPAGKNVRRSGLSAVVGSATKSSLLEAKAQKNAMNRKKIDIILAVDEKKVPSVETKKKDGGDITLKLTPAKAVVAVIAPVLDGGGIPKRSPPRSKWAGITSQIAVNQQASAKKSEIARSRLGLSQPVKPTPPPAAARTANNAAKRSGHVLNAAPPALTATPGVVKAPRKMMTPSAVQQEAKSNVDDKMAPPSKTPRGRPSATAGSSSSIAKPAGKTIPKLRRTERRTERSSSISSDSQLSCSSVASGSGIRSPNRSSTLPPCGTTVRPHGITVGMTARTFVRQSASETRVLPPGSTNKRKSVTSAAKSSESNKKVGLLAPSGSKTGNVLRPLQNGGAGDGRVLQKSPKEQHQQQQQRYHKKSKSSLHGPAHRPPPDLLPPASRHQDQLAKLETLCEVQTQELGAARTQLRESAKRFTATAILIEYLSHRLDAFACPQVKSQLARTQNELQKARSHTDELLRQRDALIQEIQSLKLEHEQQLEVQRQQHQGALSALEARLKEDSANHLEKVCRQHQLDVDSLKSSHDIMVENLRCQHEASMKERERQNEEHIDSIHQKHTENVSNLHKQHDVHLEDITERFEKIKCSLSDKLEQMRVECECLRGREQAHMLACEHAAESRLQAVLAPLQRAADDATSLRAVLELRDAELHDLRRINQKLEKKLEELPMAQERIITLEQKLENLEAIINIRTDNEKQLAAKHQVLLRRYDKESKANKRLSMNNEELAWRLSQSDEMNSSQLSSTLPTRPTMTRSGTYELLNQHCGENGGDDDNGRNECED